VRRRSQLQPAALVVAAALLGSGVPAPALAEIERADPLRVPAGAPLQPEDAARLSAEERLTRGEASLRERGHDQLPFLALAYLGLARAEGDPALARRALDIAPGIPGIRFDAARLGRRPEQLLGLARDFGTSYPGLSWLLTAVGGAVGAGLLLAAAVALVAGFARAVALHGHALGHLAVRRDPPAWPGVLALMAALGGLPLLGIGPMALIALAGAAAALRLRRPEAAGLALSLVVAALVLGPGLEHWSRVAAQDRQRYLLEAAWRVERGYPLPGDLEVLERTLGPEEAAPLPRFALASARARAGDVAGALQILPEQPGQVPRRAVRAAVFNLRGSLKLARGEVRAAIADLEGARSASESAGILFNLSQAYGRALRLSDQAPLFNAARQLDPVLISRQTSGAEPTLHSYVIPVRVPAREYLLAALAPGDEAAALALRLRELLLGRALPQAAWGALPLLGLAALMLRRSGIAHCSRCDRPVCRRCAPDDPDDPTTCTRCVRLFARDGGDARVRRQQLELDRQRRRRAARRHALLGMLVPGLLGLRAGELGRGALQLSAAGLGAALGVAAFRVASPWDVGAVGTALCLGTGLLLLVPSYLLAFSAGMRCLARARSRA
jgi:hypothetical protein